MKQTAFVHSTINGSIFDIFFTVFYSEKLFYTSSFISDIVVLFEWNTFIQRLLVLTVVIIDINEH